MIMLMSVGSSECATSTVLNGQCLRKSLAFCAWIPWARTVSQFLVATKRSMLVASLSLSMLVERDAHSACNHCASLLSLRFSRQPLFSMDTQWTSLVSPPTEEPIPLSSRVVSREHRRTCRCCVAAVWFLHHSSNQASTDAWSGLQCGNSRRRLWDLQWICVSCSHTVRVARTMWSVLIHPTWWWIFDRMSGIGAQDVKHALSPVLRKFVGRGSRMVFLPIWVH